MRNTQMEKLTLAITGAHGYIAKHFIKHYQEHFNFVPIHHIEHYNGDVHRLTQYLQDKPIDGILHLATRYEPLNPILSNSHTFVKDNILFGLDILRAINLSSLKFFINIQTPSYYDVNQPLHAYYKTKALFQDFLNLYHIYYPSIQMINLYMGDLFGLQDPRQKFLYTLFETFLNNTSFVLQHPLHHIAPVYIDDIIQALYTTIQQRQNLSEINYALYHHIYTIQEFIQYIEKNLHLSFKGKISHNTTINIHYEQNISPLPNWTEKHPLYFYIQQWFKNNND